MRFSCSLMKTVLSAIIWWILLYIFQFFINASDKTIEMEPMEPIIELRIEITDL